MSPETQTVSRPFDTSIFVPRPGSAPVPFPALNEDQLAKIQKIEDHFCRDGFDLPVPSSSPVDPSAPARAIIPESAMTGAREALSQREMMFLSRETFIRFLAATKGDTDASIKRLEEAVIWRRSVKIEEVEPMAADCGPESSTGKNIVMGFGRHQRPLMYFFPNRNTTPVEKRRAIHAIFMLERARDLMPGGVTNVMVIFNFYGKRSGQPTSVTVARHVLAILTCHYPETLAIAAFQNLPWVVKTFINLMWPFVDPVTKKKVKFGTSEGRELIKHGDVEKDELLVECGGELSLPYDHEAYWPALVKTCLDTRKRQEDAFLALGEPKVGREEKLWRLNGAVTGPDSAANGSLNQPNGLQTETGATLDGHADALAEKNETVPIPDITSSPSAVKA